MSEQIQLHDLNVSLTKSVIRSLSTYVTSCVHGVRGGHENRCVPINHFAPCRPHVSCIEVRLETREIHTSPPAPPRASRVELPQMPPWEHTRLESHSTAQPQADTHSPPYRGRNVGIFFVFPKSLRAQLAGRVAPRRGGAKRRAAPRSGAGCRAAAQSAAAGG